MVSSDTTPLHGPGSEPVTDTNFGNRLAELRKQRGLTQQAVADASGAHVTQIRRYTGDRVKSAAHGVSRGRVIESPDDLVEEVGSFGLSVFGGVVALPGEDGQELGAGAEVGAGFAG